MKGQQLLRGSRAPGLAVLVFVATASLGRAQDPTVTIKSAVGTDKQSIYGVFTVTNPGNKPLIGLTLTVVPKEGGRSYSASKVIEMGVIPDIDVPVAGMQSYDCIALLHSDDGGTPIFIASTLKANIFVNGMADKTDYGKLTNAPDVNGNTVEVVTAYMPPAAKDWAPKKDVNAVTSLIPKKGGRLDRADSMSQEGGMI